MTEKGKRAAASMQMGGNRGKMIRFLDAHGPSDLDELSEGLHTSKRTARLVARRLYQKGYLAQE